MPLALKSQYDLYLMKHRQKQNKGSRGTRDSERRKTYESEWAFQRQVKNPEFKNIEEAQKFAKKIYKTKTWQKLWRESFEVDVTNVFKASPPVYKKVRSSGRGTAGWSNGHSVTLDEMCGLNVYTLLHELTHCLGHMHHGRSFRKTLLSLVGVFMGAEHKKILKKEFRARKLACGEARKPMTFEQWKASKERMEKMRNA